MVFKNVRGTRGTADINKKILKVGLAIIGAVLVFCMVFKYFSKLKVPVFFYHYYEEALPNSDNAIETGVCTLYYITNQSDTRKVNGISFAEAPDTLFRATEEDGSNFMVFNTDYVNQYGQIYGNYSLRSVYVSMFPDGKIDSLDGLQLSTATIDFSDGTQLIADIGKISLYKSEDSAAYLEQHSTSSSSDGTASADFYIKNSFSLIKIDSPLMDKSEKIFNIRVNGHNTDDIKGIEYDRGDVLTISSAINPSTDVIEKLSFYDIKPCIYFRTAEGNTYIKRIHNIEQNSWNRRFTTMQVLKYLRARGVL